MLADVTVFVKIEKTEYGGVMKIIHLPKPFNPLAFGLTEPCSYELGALKVGVGQNENFAQAYQTLLDGRHGKVSKTAGVAIMTKVTERWIPHSVINPLAISVARMDDLRLELLDHFRCSTDLALNGVFDSFPKDKSCTPAIL